LTERDEGTMHTLNGSCHCGNIKLTFTTPNLPKTLWLRKCPCSFCHKQGNINVADPEGFLTIKIENKENIFFYQMGHKTSDRLFCNNCGVYIGGLMTHEGKPVCVINANTLDTDDNLGVPTEINVSTQTPEERVLGRLSRWMPFEIVYKST
jgi:hypothetical protein